MKISKDNKLTLISLIIISSIAIIGSLLTGNAMNTWYSTLKMPWINIPIWLFDMVRSVYYFMCWVILYRILKYTEPKKNQYISLTILLLMMANGEFWSFPFPGLKSTFVGFIGMIILSIVAIILYFNLRRNEKFSSNILLTYIIWLIFFDSIWIFELWRINK